MKELLGRPWLRRTLQVTVTSCAFLFLFWRVNARDVGRALVSVSASAWTCALLLACASFLCGVLRWWLLFRGFGATRQPSFTRLAKHYLVGFFYNTYLPGGVSGDVVRGLAARDAWDSETVGGLTTVLVERALGLAALLGLTASATLAHPLSAFPRMWLPAAVALVLVACATITVVFARSLARFGFGPVRRVLERVPVPTAWLPIGAALLLSVVTQLSPALAAFVLLRSLVPDVSLADSLVIVPLAAAAAFLPLTVSGAGVRETLFVELFRTVGIPPQAALAGSLSLWSAQAALAAVGGFYLLAAKDVFRANEQQSA
jgi:uncharacterized membrane protein YbhN (UPF0104 family)